MIKALSYSNKLKSSVSWFHKLKRSFSIQTLNTQFITQGGLLQCDFRGTKNCTLRITSKWQEHCEVTYNEDAQCNLNVLENQDENVVSIIAADTASNCDCTVDITIPEYFNVAVKGSNLNLSLINTIQGDITVKCSTGTIKADKVRGEILEFICGEADLTVHKVMEGNSVIQCRGLHAKMIMGDTVDISATHVSVDAMYGARTSIEASDHINVGLSRGIIEARSYHGDVSVSNIDGAFDLAAQYGSVKLQVNKLVPFPNDDEDKMERYELNTTAEEEEVNEGVREPVSVRGSGSRAVAPKGHIAAVVDPELAASLYCRSESGGLERICATVNSDAFELSPYNTRDQYEYEMDVRTPRPGTWEGTCVKGYLTGKSAGVKRPTFTSGASQSGKIDLSGAESQAMLQGGRDASEHSSGIQYDASNSSVSSTSEAISSVQDADGDYDLTLLARGNVRVETMSWIQIIRSKYGFEDTGISGKNITPAPGRTASSSINAAKIAQMAADLEREESNK